MRRPRGPAGRAGVAAASVALLCALAGTAASGPREAAALSLIAVPDTLSIVHDHTTAVPAPGVLANDVVVLGTKAVLDSPTTHGTVALASNGGYTYDPDPGFVGTDVFRYHDFDGLLPTNTTTVTITVKNNAPTAGNDRWSANAGRRETIDPPGVLENDDDPNGDALQAKLVAGPAHGSLTFRANGGFDYTAVPGFDGDDTFTYVATDGIANSATATVTMHVSASGSTPMPTASPPPTPTPTPIPTPPPTPRPTPPPTPRPTPSLPLPTPTLPLPTVSLPPLPSVSLPPVVLPTPPTTATPTPPPTARPTPTPTGGATPSPAPGASSTSTDPGATPSPGTGAGSGGSGGAGGSGGGGGPGGANGSGTGGGGGSVAVGSGPGSGGGSDADGPVFSVGGDGPTPVVPIVNAGLAGFDGIDWAVPALTLTVPGILLMLAVLAQLSAGAIWLPFVRRWLGAIGPSRRRRRPQSA